MNFSASYASSHLKRLYALEKGGIGSASEVHHGGVVVVVVTKSMEVTSFAAATAKLLRMAIEHA